MVKRHIMASISETPMNEKKLFELFDNLPFLADDVVVDDGVEDRQRGNDAEFFAGMCKFEYFLGNILFQKVLTLQGEKRNGLTIVNRIG